MSEETIPQMRDRIEALTKDLNTQTKRADEAEGRARKVEAREAFREAGYKPESAELFVGSHQGEITVDAAKDFAAKYGLPALEAVEPQVTEQGDPAGEGGSETRSQSNLANLSRAGSRAGEGGAATAGNEPLTRDEYNELYKTDPAAARKAVQDGRVQIRKDNPFAVR